MQVSKSFIGKIALALLALTPLSLATSAAAVGSPDDSKTCGVLEQGISGNLRIRYYMLVDEDLTEKQALVFVADPDEIETLRAHLAACRTAIVISIDGTDWLVRLRWSESRSYIAGRVVKTRQRVYIMTHEEAFEYYDELYDHVVIPSNGKKKQ